MQIAEQLVMMREHLGRIEQMLQAQGTGQAQVATAVEANTQAIRAGNNFEAANIMINTVKMFARLYVDQCIAPRHRNPICMRAETAV
jgi:hypothetical protein